MTSVTQCVNNIRENRQINEINTFDIYYYTHHELMMTVEILITNFIWKDCHCRHCKYELEKMK